VQYEVYNVINPSIWSGLYRAALFASHGTADRAELIVTRELNITVLANYGF